MDFTEMRYYIVYFSRICLPLGDYWRREWKRDRYIDIEKVSVSESFMLHELLIEYIIYIPCSVFMNGFDVNENWENPLNVKQFYL